MTNANNLIDVQGKQHYAAHSDSKAAHLLCPADHRTIKQDFRKPSYTVAINIPATAWDALKANNIPETYLGLLDTVLESAAKSILKRYVESFSIAPSSVPCELFTDDAIMAEAVGNNSEWLNKEELTAAWETSATRKRYVTDPRYTNSKDYRTAVSAFADLVLKLAGKTTNYTPEELDVILAKLDSADHETQFGTFVLKRVEALKNKKPAEKQDLMALL